MSLLKKIKTIFTKNKIQPAANSSPVKKEEKQRPHSDTQKKEPKPYNNHKRKPQYKNPKWKQDKPRNHQRPLNHQQTKQKPEKPKGKAFTELGLDPALIENLKKNNFITSTEVQEKSIPIALNGKNIFCSSETGSGKTLAFLIPMIHKFYSNEIHQALIICPTREIAIQTQKTLQSITDDALTSTLVIGGTNMELQKKALREYPKILVATPGRLLDMLNTGLIWLNYTEYVVLDEADRMLDMGFEPDLINIHSQLPGSQQTLLFSATLFPEIKKIAKRYAETYEEIVIGNPTSVANSVEHVLVEISDHEKFAALKYLISRNSGKMIVFFNTIKETINTTQKLKQQRVPRINCIHSSIDQANRENLINGFRANYFNALLASDIAARGIDIPNVDLVVNFDIPNNSEEYIHRVGRTGRAGKSGIAISFYSNKHKKKLDAIEKLIKGKIKRKNSYKGLIPGDKR
jgi:superfamily II DNA/RNA helicase